MELLSDRKKEWAKNADSIKAAHVFWGGDLRGVSLLLRATSATMKLSRRDDPNGYAGAG